ncbi:S9 family peptidase [Saccharibacillus sp. CPCC 101409]|uniref:S9 family peptidase n=1 Tax=Saccharibacillus sp. CPCC 101409 TaxID=3058041 RepID=UPI002672F901|nr:S9 family peptidase [Saccharibacillus sp. CPCC 101409]MDO3408788.1 S9 family peptidase [Saccharibacillus sp. CPCC 101409]
MLTFKKPDVEQFFRTFAIEDFAVAPDEDQLVFSTNLSGKFDLWAMDLPNVFPYPLTFNGQSCHAIKYDKRGRFLVVGFDRDGDENSQLYALHPRGGELLPLCVKEGHRHMTPILSEDGKRLYYTSTKEDPTYLSALCCDLSNGQEVSVLQGSGDAPVFLTDVSPKEEYLVYVKHFANTYAPGFVCYGDKHVSLDPDAEGEYTVTDSAFTSDSELYFLTNAGGDFTYLARFDAASETKTKVLELEGVDFTSVSCDKEHGLLYLTASKGVSDYLYAYTLEDGTLAGVPLPVDTIGSLKVTESGNLYVLGRSSVSPTNIFKKERFSDDWTPLTNYGVPGIPQEELVRPEVLTYPSFDGLEIEALFFRAPEDSSNGHTILWPHGGPQAAERLAFRSLFQFLVSRGFHIFAPNFRGSTGYGLDFCKKVEGDWGDGPRLDNIAGLDWITEKGYADRDKLLLMGGSFGGYMALLLHGRHADYFKAVVDIFGPSDLFSFIDSVPDHWKPLMNQWVGDPVKDKEKLTAYSPITYLDGMKRPMLVIQGANDPRVVKAESDQIVKALNDKGANVEYIVLDDEGHGFSKKENEMKVYRAVLEFFEKAVKEQTANAGT